MGEPGFRRARIGSTRVADGYVDRGSGEGVNIVDIQVRLGRRRLLEDQTSTKNMLALSAVGMALRGWP